MKVYLCVGIGDMMCVDGILTQKERDSITEIYWGCRFGVDLIPVMEKNPFYKITKQHIIPDELGKEAMRILYPGGPDQLFWHFMPDLPSEYNYGKKLLGIENEDVTPINVAAMFLDPGKTFQGSTFLMGASLTDIKWDTLGVQPRQYILMHYPTSTRPRSDIAVINDSDWIFVEELSKRTGLKVIIITDVEIQPRLSNYQVLIKPDLQSVIALAKYAEYYTGCDSFVAILCCKALSQKKLFIKTHDQNIVHKLATHNVFPHFLPHAYGTIKDFYKPFLKTEDICL
jgi:hypothetical protein